MRARTIRTLTFGAGAALALFSSATNAGAQAGVAQKPLPNVLLLVDTSGSMERMFDGSLPSANAISACVPGTTTSPNRWGTLVQALTGNMQPYSCGVMNRTSAGPLINEYKIAGVSPYDADYFLPHHRPLSGVGANACAVGPYKLPGGAGAGVGPAGAGYGPSIDLPAGTYADGFPNDALRNVKWTDIVANYTGPGPGTAIPIAQTCDYLQADDGQLDASRDYIRFSLMTFDQDPSAGLGVTSVNNGTVLAANPFVGQWSYTRTAAFPYGGLIGMGKPAGCATLTPFEVGSRNWAAPPWEGRLVRFADPFGTLADIERTNDQIQQVLTASRPYGATPIDAMLDDARDFLQRNPQGPQQNDPYVSGGCRDQFNILLTDGAPNLAMRASCEGAGPPAGQCPYPGSVAANGTKQSIGWDIAKSMYDAPQRIKTFVIGFSVNGSGAFPPNDGFPAALATKTCNSWYTSAGPSGFNSNSSAMSAYCEAPGTAPPAGSTADACCQLNEIAFYGSGGTAPPYFADTQRQLINAFGQVLAQITQTASTRTTPAYTATSNTSSGTNTVAGSFTAAFVPNARKPWSGQLDRIRERCNAGGVVAVPGDNGPGTPALAQGDIFDKNVARQAFDGDRLFFTVIGDDAGKGADSFRTMRPYLSTVPDMTGVAIYQGQEAGKQDMALLPALRSSSGVVPDGSTLVPAMGIDDKTCKSSRDASGTLIPALNSTDCSNVIWRFASASKDATSLAGYPYFNVRCKIGSDTCAATGVACPGGDTQCDTANKGDVCVPACSGLGAIFRSTPATAAQPNSLNRDEGYRAFAEARKARPPALFVATTDGVLHGFKALDDTLGITGKHELFAFVPPAVLPRLASNYPAGQQILLDGSPVVKDVVWDRGPTETAYAQRWHTTLVAGLGSNGPGYYALNVSDVNCSSASGCTSATFIPAIKGQPDTASVAAQAGAGLPVGFDYATSKVGPHFLWQLTDIERLAGDPVAVPTVRTTKPALQGGDNKKFVALFGKQTATPAIATLLFKPDPALPAREIGVAILPGGSDGPPVRNGLCNRGLAGGGYTTATFPDLSDPRGGVFAFRNQVRQWAPGPSPNCTAPVAGRSVTIVRLDTGEIVRHFGRAVDTPAAIRTGTRFTDSPFDSPMTGTPVAFPNDVGRVASRAFIGDADGTMWRLDFSAPNPVDWKVSIFQDLFGDGTGADGQPVAIAPVASLDPTGNLVINVATGEQENLVATTAFNKVFSIVEGKPVSGNVRAQVQWYTKLPNGERVTGPMAVFDSTLYFASYLPEQTGGSGVCSNKAKPFIWAVDYFRAVDPTAPALGGLPKYPPTQPGVSRPVPGGYDFSAAALAGNTLVPGVGIKQSLSCATDVTVGTGDYFGMQNYGVSSQTASSFTLEIPVAKGSVSGGVQKLSIGLPKPRTPTTIDSWALVVD